MIIALMPLCHSDLRYFNVLDNMCKSNHARMAFRSNNKVKQITRDKIVKHKMPQFDLSPSSQGLKNLLTVSIARFLFS